MTKEEFEAWKQEGTTKEFFKYLKDYLEKLTIRVGEDYLSTNCVGVSGIDMVRNHAIQHGTFTAVTDIIDLKYQDIENFYYKEEKNEL